jgi:hypothetical protein
MLNFQNDNLMLNHHEFFFIIEVMEARSQKLYFWLVSSVTLEDLPK